MSREVLLVVKNKGAHHIYRRRELLSVIGGMTGSGFIGSKVNAQSPASNGPVDDGNTLLKAPRALQNAGAGALWGPTARDEHESRALNNGQIRAP